MKNLQLPTVKIEPRSSHMVVSMLDHCDLLQFVVIESAENRQSKAAV